MDNNIDNNPQVFAARAEELAILVWNEEQSATPNLQHARIHGYDADADMQFQNTRHPPNMGILDYSPTTLSTIGALQLDTAADVTTTPPGFTLQDNQRFGLHWGVWVAGFPIYLGICGLLVTFFQLRFQSETDSPFETHLGFIIMSIAAFFMTLSTSGILAYTDNDLQSLMKDHFSPVYDVILKSVLCFSAILTLVSLLLLLFVPENYNWVGYLIICALFVAILALHFNNLKKLIAPQNTNNLGGSEAV